MALSEREAISIDVGARLRELRDGAQYFHARAGHRQRIIGQRAEHDRAGQDLAFSQHALQTGGCPGSAHHRFLRG